MGKLVAEESGAASDPETGLISVDRTMKNIIGIVKRVPRIVGYGYGYGGEEVCPEDTILFPWNLRGVWVPVTWLFSVSGAPGTRLPHLSVDYKGKLISTLDLCGKSFILITSPNGSAWLDAARKVSKSSGVEVSAYRAGAGRDCELSCGKGDWESAAGISSAGALLVRPGWICGLESLF